MIQELIYTSARKGLKPGTRGYCTVAHTKAMSPAVIRLLESISAYGDPAARQNGPDNRAKTVAISHYRAQVQHQYFSVLSRISATRAEHTNRDNKIAHHVVLDCNDRPLSGPAAIASQLDFYSEWRDEPRLLDPRPQMTIDNGDNELKKQYAEHWERLTGDPGWAGFLAHHFCASPNRPIYLIYETGTVMLPLLTESLALIPMDKRWLVTFNTCFMRLPSGMSSCLWRCCPAGGPQARESKMLKTSLLLDLTRPLGSPPPCHDVQVARGEALPRIKSRPASRIKPVNNHSRAGDTVRISRPLPEKNKLKLRRRSAT